MKIMKKIIAAQVTDELLRDLKDLAKKNERTVSAEVRLALKCHMEQSRTDGSDAAIESAKSQ